MTKICPLCGEELPSADLPAHILAESDPEEPAKAAGLYQTAPSADADPCWPAPPAGQQIGELQAACAAELGSPVGGWSAASLPPDRAAATQHRRACSRLTDLIGVAGSFVDGAVAGRAAVEGRRVVGLSAGPAVRDAAEALLYAPGWAGGPAWMETGDLAGGFRQLVHFPDFRLAVSRSGRLEGPVLEVCVPPAGWRVARAAELLAAGFRVGGRREPLHQYYGERSGWRAGHWGGVNRIVFVTADWQTADPFAGGAVFAANFEGRLEEEHPTTRLRATLPHRHFAGVVCVRDGECDRTARRAHGQEQRSDAAIGQPVIAATAAASGSGTSGSGSALIESDVLDDAAIGASPPLPERLCCTRSACPLLNLPVTDLQLSLRPWRRMHWPGRSHRRQGSRRQRRRGRRCWRQCRRSPPGAPRAFRSSVGSSPAPRRSRRLPSMQRRRRSRWSRGNSSLSASGFPSAKDGRRRSIGRCGCEPFACMRSGLTRLPAAHGLSCVVLWHRARR